MATHHQYAPISVQTFPEGVVSQQNMPLPLSASKQAELLERLKQLRAWQQRQQADLLRQQQEQLLRLRNEQQSAVCERAHDSCSTRESSLQGGGRTREGVEVNFMRLASLPESPCALSSDEDTTSEPNVLMKPEHEDALDDVGGIYDRNDCEYEGEFDSRSNDVRDTNFGHVHVSCYQGYMLAICVV